MIRPYLEYAVQVWNPSLLGYKESFKKLQRRATKTPAKLSKLSNDQILAKLGLKSLKERRVRRDLIQMFKIMNGFEVVEWEKDFKQRTRGHSSSYNMDSFKSRKKMISLFLLQRET